MKFFTIITPLLLVGVLAMLLVQGQQIRTLRTDVVTLRDEVAWSQAGPEAPSAAPDDDLHEESYNSPKDIAKRIASVAGGDVQGFAMAVAEVDGWIFHPDQEEAAKDIIGKLVSDLRGIIRLAISAETDKAIKAASGTEGAKHLTRAGELFGLYPQPSSEAERTEAEALSATILGTARRVEDLRRLRYNDWAAHQIEQGLSGFHQNKKTFGDDSEALIRSCVSTLGPVETSSLEPAVLALYQEALSMTTEALSEPGRVKLAKELSSTSIDRKSPADF